MNLVIDIGNSATKMAILNGGIITKRHRVEQLTVDIIEQFLDCDTQQPLCAIICAVGVLEYSVVEYMQKRFGGGFVLMTHSTPIPITNSYGTPKTLGLDRLASAIGATICYESKNLMVVDLGSAITIDYVKNGIFLGGNISPGANLRFKSLNSFTSLLPLCQKTDNILQIGTSTLTAIQSGVLRGIIFELEGYIREMGQENKNFNVIFTGGDANYFADKLKNAIFVNPDLVLLGLNEVLDYNNAITEKNL